ncbi:MAG TPA: hypothetical protein PKL15_02935 [Saprospiraceae bacterium]|nr:hypothetical protein [Saprospiraceae bacterium]
MKFPVSALCTGLAVLYPQEVAAQLPCPAQKISYDVVETALFSRYRVSGAEVEPVKRIDGYYVRIDTSGGNEPAREFLFYSSTTGDYSPLPLPPADTSQRHLFKTGKFSGNDAYNFDSQPCYGYAGWYQDAIRVLEAIPNPTDDQLNALARAYSRGALELTFLNKDTGEGVVPNPFVYGQPGQLRFTREGIRLFVQWSDHAIALYDRLQQRSPAFLTPVGCIDTKYANERMEQYGMLRMYGEDSLANRPLERGLYRPFIREAAANILLSCPPNAILLTCGDSDTYPLWYLQYTEGLRRDVSVIPIVLLTNAQCNLFWYDKTFWSDNAPTRTLPRSYYEKSPLLLFSDLSWLGVSDTLDVEGFLKKAVETDFITKEDWTREQGFVTARHLWIALKDIPGHENLEKSGYLQRYYGATDTLFFNLPQYTFTDHQTIIDWTFTEGWRRPVCFAPTNEEDALDPYAAHLVQEGLVYRLMPIQAQPPGRFADIQFPIQLEASWKLWREVFQRGSQDAITPLDAVPLFQADFMLGMRMYNAFMQSGKKKKARQVLDDLCRYYPNERKAWNAQMLAVAKGYARTGNKAEANRIIITVLDNFDGQLLSNSDMWTLQNSKSYLWSIIGMYKLKDARERYLKTFDPPAPPDQSYLIRG